MKVSKTYSLLIFTIGLAFLSSGLSALSDSKDDGRKIRVAILKDVDHVDLSASGAYEIIDAVKGTSVQEGRRLRRTTIKNENGRIRFDDKIFPTNRLRFSSSKEISIHVADTTKEYRGDIDILIVNKKFVVLNVLPLESYVRGVLYHEVPYRWPMEVLKAQAVTARTYAIYKTETNADQLYDVSSDIYSQVYGGQSAERYRTNLAVNRTTGKVLAFGSQVLPAFFHSNCGGHTENVKELWKYNLPPLSGRACPFCKTAPHSEWKKNFRSQDVQEKLSESGYNVGLIEKIEIMERNGSGRIRNLEITSRDGRTTTISGKDFRNIIGPNLIKSNKYQIVMQGYYFDMIGAGWGHGVGMCQWGAYQMALERHDYEEILSFYYPGAEIVDITETNLKPHMTDTERNELIKSGKLKI
jgi:stage II sporulation protein D